jgi:hypothetical protein
VRDLLNSIKIACWRSVIVTFAAFPGMGIPS